jgi:hypothetical protein
MSDFDEAIKKMGEEPKMLALVKCGFNKWAIGVDSNYTVKVSYDYHPGYLSLDLHDVSPDELRKLGNMFHFLADQTKKAV